MTRGRRATPAPPRLLFERGALGELMREADRSALPLDQPNAFHGLVDRARGHHRARRNGAIWAVRLAAACLVVIAIGAIFRHGNESRDVAESDVGGPSAGPSPLGRVAVADPARPAEPAPGASAESAPSPRSFALPAGVSRLEDGTRLDLGERSAARAEVSEHGLRVALAHGAVSLEVAKQAPGRTLEVQAHGFRFVVLGTVFRVSNVNERVVLDVREGRVAVFEGDRKLAERGAGESWAGTAGTASAQREIASREAGLRAGEARAPRSDALNAALADAKRGERADERGDQSTSEIDCLGLARARRPREAETCFERRAARSGLGAEVALFELARLRGDVLGDSAGALRALNEYRTRFPAGSLRVEVDVSHVQLLSRLGRHAEVLSESATLLGTRTGRERGGELRMLRANTYRTALKDFQSAEREYAEAERGRGRLAGEASYYRGLCLEALGNPSSARAAYERYLAVPGRAREAEARRRLQELR